MQAPLKVDERAETLLAGARISESGAFASPEFKIQQQAHELFNDLADRKLKFCAFVESIQRKYQPSIFLTLNPTFIKNPHLSTLPKRFFFENFSHKKSFLSLFFNVAFAWVKNTVLLALNFAFFCLYRLKKTRPVNFSETEVIVDAFLRVDILPSKLCRADKLYFPGLFEKMEAAGIKFCFLPRLINQNKNNRNPFHLLSLIEKINSSETPIALEFDFLKPFDYFKMFCLILVLPITPVFYQQKENSQENKLFNACLIDDIRYFDFEAVKRYFVARRVRAVPRLSAILSWCENQAIDRAFNYGIREKGFAGKIIGCQLFLSYLSYFSSEPSDLDHQQHNAPDMVVVNGKAYLRKLKRIQYELGESLRYKAIFSMPLDQSIFNAFGVVILASYIQEETKYMMEITGKIPERILLKLHPTQCPDMFRKFLSPNCSFTESNVYELFKSNSIFIATASGSALEAVACGKSVIIVGKTDTIVACPLTNVGKGEIWEIVFSEYELGQVFNQLMNKRKTEPDKILAFAAWYRDNFFVEKNDHFPLGMLNSLNLQPKSQE